MNPFSQVDLYYKIIRKYFYILLILFILSFGYPLKSIIFPKLLVYIFDKIKKKTNLDKYLTYFFICFAFIYLIMLIYEIIMIMVVKINVKKDILDIFYKNIFFGLEEDYTEIPGPNVFSNIFHFSNGGQSIFSYFFSTVFPYIITFFCVGIYLIYLGHSLIGYSFIIINILLYILPFLYIKNIKKRSQDLVQYRNQTEINIFDIFWNIYNIFSSNEQKSELKKIDTMTETIRKLSSNRWSITFISIIIGRLIMISFICWVVYYIFKKYKNNSISLKSLTNLVLIIVFVTYEFFYSYYIWHTLIIEILEQEMMLIEINKSMSRFINKNKQVIKGKIDYSTILQVKNISFSYNNKTSIFNNVNYSFKKNKSYAIIGNIGCGKSSFLKLLFGIYKPYKGDIIINNNIHRNLTINKNWRKYFNYLQQHPVLFARTIDDNISYGNKKSRVELLIQTAGLSDNISKIKKEKKNQKLKKLGEGVSGGQKQIINLLRILTSPKDIILMDEPSSSLDPVTRKLFYKMFNILKKSSKTIILVTHDMKLAKLCDKIINFDKYRVT